MTTPHVPFVFGHPRSGTSLLTAILDRHSKIAMMPETHLLSGLRDMPLPRRHEQFLLLAWDRLRTRMGDLHLPPDEVLERFRVHPCSPEGLLHALLELWAERAGKPVAGEKTPSHLRFADCLLTAIPESRAIVLVRDGRAVVAAMRRTELHTETPIERLVHGWTRSAQLCDRWLGLFPERARLVRFEDLVTDGEQVLRPLFEWLGAGYEPGVMEPGPTTTFRGWEDYVKQDVVRPIMPEKAAAWKEGESLFSPEMLHHMAPWLERFAYPVPVPVAGTRLAQPTEAVPPHRRISSHSSRPPVMLIGAHRAGTASLNAWLGMHPEVAPAPPRSRPFFALDWPLSRDELLRHLDAGTDEPVLSEQVRCHAASYYLAHPDLPRRLHKLMPEARILVVLRDPVARAFSQWLHAWRVGAEPYGFDRAVEAERARIGEAESVLAVDESAASFAHVHYSYELQGRYASQLGRWRCTFPRERMLVLTLDELVADSSGTWERVCGHVGLAHTPAPSFPKLESLAWPLSLEAVQRSPGGQRLRHALRGDTSRLMDLLQRELPWMERPDS